MSSPASSAGATGREQLGGARAGFLASLARKVGDARELLASLEADPTSKKARQELRRRLHALGAGARLLRLDAMATALHETLLVLDRSAESGSLRKQDAVLIAQTLGDMPALAWGEGVALAESEDEGTRATLPFSILVVGSDELADALSDEAAPRSRAFECERTDDTQTALELARAHAPDAIVVDIDLPAGSALVEALLRDPMAEPVPVLVVGTVPEPNDAPRWFELGATTVLAKPVTPGALRRACEELIQDREVQTARMVLGEPTLEQLAERLGEELRSALLDGVEPSAHSCRVPLGEGIDVLGALWGTIARVQEIVTRKTGGAITFHGKAPEGAVALAPWLHQDLPASDRVSGRGLGAATDVSLTGRRVVVADDDPGVTWFLSDLLRAEGCEVHEALDGARALDIAWHVQPELVISDILMPGIDGFSLCRRLRRDVALRDTPVILLSWKEDLLQRVRELGASAAAYMRKETDSRAILARVREVLRPRARMEARLRTGGEIRGRLDGLTPRLLLSMVCDIRKDARVGVRDATYFYEIEIRDGAPRKATRTASDGSYQRGERALAGLLGVGAARFSVAPAEDLIRGDLRGTLVDQLAIPIAAARGALAAIAGPRIANVDRILLDETALEEYLAPTPDPANALIKRIAHGTSPRELLLAGEASPSLIEDVLSDLAARGVIRGVEGRGGADLLTPEVAHALAVLKGTAAAVEPPTVAFPAMQQTRPMPGVGQSRHGEVSGNAAGHDKPHDSSTLDDAVMRELSRSPEPQNARAVATAELPAASLPPLVEPGPVLAGDHPPQLAESEDSEALLPRTSPRDEPTVRVLRRTPTGAGEYAADPIDHRVAPAKPKRSGLALTVLAFGMLGIAIGSSLRKRDREAPRSTERPTAPGAPSVSAPSSSASPIASSVASPVRAAETDLHDAEPMAQRGLVEVTAPAGAHVRIDGIEVGMGPLISTVALPGYHEVGVVQGARESKQTIEVRAGKTTRINSTVLP